MFIEEKLFRPGIIFRSCIELWLGNVYLLLEKEEMTTAKQQKAKPSYDNPQCHFEQNLHHHHEMTGTDLMSCSISGVSGGLAMKTRPMLTPLLLSCHHHINI